MGFDGFVEVMRYVFLCDIIIPEIREKDKRKNGENTEKTIKTRFSGFRGSYVPFFCVGGGAQSVRRHRERAAGQPVSNAVGVALFQNENGLMNWKERKVSSFSVLDRKLDFTKINNVSDSDLTSGQRLL